MLLTANDLQFLASETDLTGTKLELLLEEDEDLLLEVLSQRENHQVLMTISFPTYVRLCILKETKDSKFTYIEKNYVAEAVAVNYPKIYKQSPYLIDKNKFGESEAQFYLVTAGIFPEYLEKLERKGAPSPEYYVKAAKIGFQRADKRDIADHIFEWVESLNRMRKTQWSFQSLA
jgi:hypothetical protein